MLGKISVSLFFVGLLAGCQTTSVNTSYNSNYENYDKHSRPILAEKKASKINNDNDLWQLTRNHLAFSEHYANARVVKEIARYNRYPLHMSKVSKQASPYYYYVLQEVIKRGYPSEVALLPVIESLYDPTAYSSGKAAGIWQFIPSTATYLGVKIDAWYDGRRDTITSTKTALDYLARLNKRFDSDWMLTFAAYNSGGGTVSKAIRKNREQGLATDYWSLKLPKETTHYVPRILAIAALVDTPNQYNIKIPTIPSTAHFKEVQLDGQIDLSKAATLAEVSLQTIHQLNPGFNRNATPPNGPHRILVPFDKASQFEVALSSLDPSDRLNSHLYKVIAGDSLGVIAQRYNIPTAMLKSANAKTSSRIRIGETLIIPSIGLNEIAKTVQKKKRRLAHKTHTIDNGDTVWDIAKKHKLSVKDILAFNGMSKNSTLRIGASIKIPRG